MQWRINRYVLGFIGLILISACKKYLDIPTPRTQIETASVFENDKSAVSAVIGLYSEMSRSNLALINGGITVYAGLASDEIYNTASSADFDQYATNSILPTNSPGLGRLWSQGYKYIYHANIVLEGLEKSTELNDSLKRQLTGEMFFTRALNYFYLVNLFGDVPLILGTHYQANASTGRTAINEVYIQIKNDLIAAKQLLGNNYASANKARPNRWAACALLARVYLYLQDWTNAEQEASEVLQSGMYSLAATVSNVFAANSTETIWQLPRDNNNTADGITFVPSSAIVRPNHALTQQLLNAFENNDQRKSNWIKANVVSGISYSYPFKYKVRAATPITEYLIVFRLAEQYLIRAEARARLANFAGARADLNIIRSRAGLTSIQTNEMTALLQSIIKERQTELFAEFGHRWLDLKRTELADIVLSSLKGNFWQATDKLFPILQNEMELNPSMVQNPGY